MAVGTHLINCLREALMVPGIDRMAWVDCHGYDGWPSLAFLEATSSEASWSSTFRHV